MYSFTIFTHDPFDDELIERVYGACDDATATSENGGKLAIGFDRDASSLEEALRSALNVLRGLRIQIDTITIESQSVAELV